MDRQGCLNARLAAGDTLQRCHADAASLALLSRTAAERGISARGQHRILRVARSIADLEQRAAVQFSDMSEALSLRLEEPQE
jgi:magnesium chelatase family protein